MNHKFHVYLLITLTLIFTGYVDIASPQGTCNSGPGDTLEALIAGGCSHIVMGADLTLNTNLTYSGDLIIEKSQSVSTPLKLTLNGMLRISNGDNVRLEGISIEWGMALNGLISISNVGSINLSNVDLYRASSISNTPLSLLDISNSNISIQNSRLGSNPDFLRILEISYNDSNNHKVEIIKTTFRSSREAVIIKHLGDGNLLINLSNSSFTFPSGYIPMETPRDGVQIHINGGLGNEIYLSNLFFQKRGLGGIQNATLINISSGYTEINIGESIKAEFWQAGTPPRQHTNPLRIIGEDNGRFKINIRRESYISEKSFALSIDLYGNSSGLLNISSSEFGRYSILTNISIHDGGELDILLNGIHYTDLYIFNINMYNASKLTVEAGDILIDEGINLFRISLIDSPMVNISISNITRNGVGNDPLLLMDIGSGLGNGHRLTMMFNNVVDRAGNLFNIIHLGRGYSKIDIVKSKFRVFSIYGNYDSFFNISISKSVFDEAQYDLATSSYKPLDISGAGVVTVRWRLSIRFLRSFMDPVPNNPVNITYMGYTLASGYTNNQGIFNASLSYKIYDSNRGLKIYVARYLTVIGWIEDKLVRYRLGLDRGILGPVKGIVYDVYPDDLILNGYGADRDMGLSLYINGREGRFTIYRISNVGSFKSHKIFLEGVKDYIDYVIYIGVTEGVDFRYKVLIIVDGSGSIKLIISGEVYRLYLRR